MSVGEYRWQVYPQNTQLSEKIGESLNVHPIIAQTLLNRGLRSLEEANTFLNPLSEKENKFPSNWTDELLSILSTAIEKKKKILIYGDYDVDGMTSVAQLYRFLTHCNANVSYKIPHRFVEGYGISHHLITAIKERPLDLLITLDCGITNTAEIKAIKELGTDVIIVDHHTIPDPPPPANLIINPKALEVTHPLYGLCTAGIVYILMKALQPHLAPDFPLENELDLVALGTIADVAPLTGENRRLTLEGLFKLSKRRRIGIDELLIESEFKHPSISPRDVGFTLAPRLNAAGRLKSASLGVELLLETDRKKATECAQYLNKLNRERQKIGEYILQEAIEKLEKEDLNAPIVVLSGKNWHPGIVGIIASRLVERTQRPVVLITEQETICRASARSIGQVNLYKILKRGEYLYSAFGGHKEAAGFSIEHDRIPELKKVLHKAAEELISEEDRKPIIDIDVQINPQDLDLNLAEKLNKLGPFGQKNPAPTLYSNTFKVIESRLVGERGTHLKVVLSDNFGNSIIDGIGFNMNHKLDITKKKNPEFVFNLEVNTWKGKKSAQIKLIDLK